MRSERKGKENEAFDYLLSRALIQRAEPDAALQQKVLAKWKEREEMKRGKKWAVSVAAAVCVLAVTVSAGAASRYLSSSRTAEEFGYEKMAEAFSRGDALLINETQTCGNYTVTLMGVASGKDLGTVIGHDDGSVTDDFTYAVVAIERTDGTPMPDGTNDSDDPAAMEFFVSPLVRGLNPVNYNAVTMNGGCSWKVIDGVRYQIAECDNVECFADRGMYICVMNDIFYNKAAYCYDKESGKITPNDEYDGMNLLFDLPLDESKADPEAAKAYLDSFEVPFPDADKE